MSYEVKFGWIANKNLCFAAYQPNGTGRGVEQQPLPEVRDVGYYRATPAESLVISDVVLVYQFENVTAGSDTVTSLGYADVVSNGIRVHAGGDLVSDFNTIQRQVVTSVNNPVGSGEYDDLVGTSDSIDDLTTGQTTVLNQYDERDGGGVGAGDGVESLVTHDC